jgi:hypothetical protein
MSRTAMTSNIYYLPPRNTSEDLVERPARRTTWRSRLTRTWWRIRFMTAEICSILRRGGRHLSFDDGPVFLGSSAEIFERPRARRAEPARVLDFEAARVRLRPARV